MSTGARVHDIGYRSYDGPRGGRLGAIWWLARWSALRALGRRRGWTAKLMPISLALLAFLPGMGLLAVRALVADQFDAGELPIDILPYSAYFGVITVIILVWTAGVAPEMVCPDRRDRVLSLYFATATSPREYLAGKVLGALLPLLVITVGPVLVLFGGNTVFAEDAFSYLGDQVGQLPRIIAGGFLISLYYALLGLAVSSLTSRRAFAAGGFTGLMLLSAFVAGSLAFPLDLGRGFLALNLFTLPANFTRHVFFGADDLPVAPLVGVFCGVIVLSALVLLARYRSPRS
ncbi:MAG: ABC transporter permease [Thermoleophilia bacterium]